MRAVISNIAMPSPISWTLGRFDTARKMQSKKAPSLDRIGTGADHLCNGSTRISAEVGWHRPTRVLL